MTDPGKHMAWHPLPPFAPTVCDMAAQLGEEAAGNECRLAVQADALDEMVRCATLAPHIEVLGLLLGTVLQDERTGHRATLVQQVHMLPDAPASRVFVRADANAWAALWPSLPARAQVVGWFHTHPGHGIFFSATDRNTQRQYFQEPWQVGVVMDPVRMAWGAFAGALAEPVPMRIVPPGSAPVSLRCTAAGAPDPEGHTR